MPVKATGWPSISRVFAPNLRLLSPADHGLWISTVRLGCKPQAIELAIERRAADLQPPGYLGHLAAAMGDGEADDLAFDRLQTSDIAGGVDECEAGIWYAGGRRSRGRFGCG